MLQYQMASTKIETLDMLLGTYQDIGDVLDGIKKYDKLFKNYPDFRKILEDYFYDILEFHHAVLVAFGKPRGEINNEHPSYVPPLPPSLSAANSTTKTGSGSLGMSGQHSRANLGRFLTA